MTIGIIAFNNLSSEIRNIITMTDGCTVGARAKIDREKRSNDAIRYAA